MKTFIAACKYVCAAALLCSNAVILAGSAQEAKPQAGYPAHLPYGFANFVWWSDDELHTLLKKKIPSLGDEIETTNVSIGRVRDALTALLKEKGIVAQVQSEEPALDLSKWKMVMPPGFRRAQSQPPPTPKIMFSVLSPPVMIGKMLLMPEDEPSWQSFQSEAKKSEHRPFGRFGLEVVRERAQETLQQRGYLSAEVKLSQQPPRLESGRWYVDPVLTANVGPRYTVSVIHVDGGPLLQGRDFSQFLFAKVGDPAGPDPFGRLIPAIRSYYQHAGYEDVDLDSKSALDVANAQVTYQLSVTEGPQYHLRSLTIQRLTLEQESRVRTLLGMKAGDIYDGNAVTDLYQKLSTESSLSGLSFSFMPTEDVEAAAMDLKLSFFKTGDEGHVTVQ
jgi:hypothetical protein